MLNPINEIKLHNYGKINKIIRPKDIVKMISLGLVTIHKQLVQR